MSFASKQLRTVAYWLLQVGALGVLWGLGADGFGYMYSMAHGLSDLPFHCGIGVAIQVDWGAVLSAVNQFARCGMLDSCCGI